MHFEPHIHMITMENSKAIIDSIPFTELIFNLCDGCDVDGLPGPSIGMYLSSKICQNSKHYIFGHAKIAQYLEDTKRPNVVV